MGGEKVVPEHSEYSQSQGSELETGILGARTVGSGPSSDTCCIDLGKSRILCKYPQFPHL